jgi:hypothetical protein
MKTPHQHNTHHKALYAELTKLNETARNLRKEGGSADHLKAEYNRISLALSAAGGAK